MAREEPSQDQEDSPRGPKLITSEEEEREALEWIERTRQGANILDSDNVELGISTEFEVLQPMRGFPTFPVWNQRPLSPTRISGGTPSNTSTRAHSQDSESGEALSKTERLQESDEASTRKYFNTMNQKAPRPGQKKKTTSKTPGEFAARLGYSISPPKPAPKKKGWEDLRGPNGNPLRIHVPVEIAAPKVDPSPEFIMEVNSNFEEMMKGVRGFRGEVLVHAEFGRIILKNIASKYVTHAEKQERLHKRHTLVQVLEPEPQKGALLPYTFFSKVLTTIPADINHLVDMKDSKGQKLWAKKLSWKVNYQFLGRDESIIDFNANSFIIDVDAENFKWIVKKHPRTLGEINIHGTKRNWDFRISAVGNESFDESCDECYKCNCGELADAIKKSLYVP
jgi:hypothetical protein